MDKFAAIDLPGIGNVECVVRQAEILLCPFDRSAQTQRVTQSAHEDAGIAFLVIFRLFEELVDGCEPYAMTRCGFEHHHPALLFAGNSYMHYLGTTDALGNVGNGITQSVARGFLDAEKQITMIDFESVDDGCSLCRNFA